MLRKIVLRNFMCFADKTVELDKRISIVSGQNGKGKTTIGTAILWALFNKNYELKDNPVIRKTDVSDKSDVEVELVFDDITFRKVQKRKRSEKNPTEYADTNSYYVNEVPCTMKEYNERIGKDQKILLWGCAVNAFLSEKPDVLRAFLFDHIEGISDLDVAKTTPELADLAKLLEKYNIEEVRAMNKKIVSDSNKDSIILEGQIKEKERDIQIASDIDVSVLELQKSAIKERIADIEGKIEDSDKLFEEKQKASDGIIELKFKLSDMERNASEETDKKRRELDSKIVEIRNEIHSLERDKEFAQGECAGLESRINATLDKIKQLQSEWKEEKERVFDESSLVCPYCGQEYQEDKKTALMSEFEAHKVKELQRITEEGNAKNSMLTEMRKRVSELAENIKSADVNIQAYKIDESSLINQYEAIAPVSVRNTDEYIALEKEIAEKEQAMNTWVNADSMRIELKSQLKTAKNELDTVTAELLKSSTEQHEKRLEELLEQSRTIEQNKADAERILDLADQLERAKNTMLSEKVNSMFNIVDFQLFEFAKNGSYKNCCIPTIDGKSLMDNNANKALRILGKMDICNTIQHLENFDLPVLLDDGESLDNSNLARLAGLTDKQIIILRVTDDAELQIK